MDSDGYIITSSYNFINNPTGILVNLPDRDESLPAKRIANDKSRMLTLIKVEAKGLPVPAVVSKKEMQEGQWSIALGRTLDAKRAGAPSISLGIVSARNRIWGKALQTDCKVSPINYGGPLVDIQGRVQGIIIPASPHTEGVTAGFEWYDSGIGFAVPLEDVLAVLPRLKEGKDLDKGLLGVQMKSPDDYAVLPEIGAVVKDSAAEKAGLKPGDVITEVDGHRVTRMAEIKHIVGVKYAGDKVAMKVKRGKEEQAAVDIVLGGTAPITAPPFLGLLPMRDDPALGVEVRFVYPKSPAEKIGLAPGDRIVKFGPASGNLIPFTGEKRGRAQLLEWLNGQTPGSEVQLEVKRKAGKTETLKVTLDQMPGTLAGQDDMVPERLPQPASFKKGKAPLELLDPNAKPKAAEPNPGKAETGTFKRTTADGQHTYWVYVHRDYDPNVAHSLLVWLHPPGKFKEEDVDDFVDLWDGVDGRFCKDHNMILLIPLTTSDSGWVPADDTFIVEAMKAVIAEYAIDRQRVVTHGMGVGGQMAIYLGFTERDLVRGVATTGAVVTQVMESQRDKRLSFYLAGGGVDPIIKSIAESRIKLTEKSYPVIFREIANRGREYLEDAQIREVVRWIDALDRL